MFEYDDDFNVKSTDDFYTYNSKDFDERVNQDTLVIADETDTWDPQDEWN